MPMSGKSPGGADFVSAKVTIGTLSTKSVEKDEISRLYWGG